MDENLAGLLIDLTDLSDKEAEWLVFEKYVELYLVRGMEPRRMGIRQTHDGTVAKFAESRFRHAFRTSSKAVRRFGKDILVRSRGERVPWIGPVIAGKIAHTECWMVPQKDERQYRRRPLRNRLYLLRDECYVVWLEPTRDGGWWFSSAYVAGLGDIRRYCKAGYKLWEQKNTP